VVVRFAGTIRLYPIRLVFYPTYYAFRFSIASIAHLSSFRKILWKMTIRHWGGAKVSGYQKNAAACRDSATLSKIN
jgi:hypothetical protein